MAAKTFYDYPALYDALHAPDTALEAVPVLDIVARHGNGGRAWLEPACGTGRYMGFFAQHGIRVTGYDVNARALAMARRRKLHVVRASMTTFRRRGRFDAAYSLIGTFRHLLTERDALRHLRLTAEALRPGGVYVIGLDLVDYDDCPADEEGWEVIHKGRKLQHLYMTLPPQRRRRREKVINFVTADHRVLQDEYDLRSYDAGQWRRLIAASPLRLAGTYTAEGKLSQLNARTRYALFVLRK